jgi:hypothetical protein
MRDNHGTTCDSVLLGIDEYGHRLADGTIISGALHDSLSRSLPVLPHVGRDPSLLPENFGSPLKNGGCAGALAHLENWAESEVLRRSASVERVMPHFAQRFTNAGRQTFPYSVIKASSLPSCSSAIGFILSISVHSDGSAPDQPPESGET